MGYEKLGKSAYSPLLLSFSIAADSKKVAKRTVTFLVDYF